MPYISDAERERARWMTLTELIAHIEREGCERSAALKQIRNALSDRKLSIKWEKEPLRLSRYILYAHQPPESASFWQQADIDDDAKVFDPETENRRTLLILKNDVFALWPVPSAASAGSKSRKTKGRGTLLIPKQSALQFWGEPSVASAASESGKPGPITKPKRRYHRRDENEIHRALGQLFQQGLNLEDLYQKERAALVSKECGKRYDKRTVEKYFRSWPKKHRTDA